MTGARTKLRDVGARTRTGAGGDAQPHEPCDIRFEADSLVARAKSFETRKFHQPIEHILCRIGLEACYPCVLRYLGADLFGELAGSSAAATDYNHRTPGPARNRLPEVIAEVHGLPHPRFVRDLSRVELAAWQVIGEEESPNADLFHAQRLPRVLWSHLQCAPIRALRLLELDYAAHQYAEAVWRGIEPPGIRRSNTWLLLYRRGGDMKRLLLTRPAYELFVALIEGDSLGEAIRVAIEVGGVSSREIREWFDVWARERLFADVGFR